MRTLVAIRFEKAVRAWLERGDVAGRAAVADLVGEMAVTARGIGSRSDFPLKRLALLVPDLEVLAQAKEARLQEAAARTLGKIQPDRKDVKNDAGRLGSLLKADGATTRRVAAEALVNLIRIEAQTKRRNAHRHRFHTAAQRGHLHGAAVVRQPPAVSAIAMWKSAASAPVLSTSRPLPSPIWLSMCRLRISSHLKGGR